MTKKELLFIKGLRDLLQKCDVNIEAVGDKIIVYGKGIDTFFEEGTMITAETLTKIVEKYQ